MKIFDCKCQDCKAEFQAVLADEKDTVACPACEKKNVAMTEAVAQPGCGSGCSGCGGSCSTE